MKQVPLRLVCRPAPTFDNFVPGLNEPVVSQLRSLVTAPTPVLLWGESGCGKSHLLAAWAREVASCASLAQDAAVAWFRPDTPPPWNFDAGIRLIILDDVDRLNGDQQHEAFALLLQSQAHGIPWAAAALRPPVDLPLREDLRSRLGGALVFALAPLPEFETRAVLQGEALRRGIDLGDALLDYLLHRYARDLGFLMRLFDELDAYALSESRAVTVPLLRQMLAREGSAPWAPEPGDAASVQR